MVVKVDGKGVLERVRRKVDDRKKVSLYLSEEAYSSFKKACDKEKVSASVVMEELMTEFVASLKK